MAVPAGPMAQARIQLLVLLIAALLVPELALLARVARDSSLQRDFGAYYNAARQLRAGASVYSRPTPGPGSDDGPATAEQFIYPPFLAVVLRPIAALPYSTAARLWLGWSLMAIVVATCVLARSTGVARTWTTGLAAAGFLVPWAEVTLWLGQINGTLLLCLAAFSAWLSARSGRSDAAAGVVLAVAGAVKAFPLALVAALIRPARRAALAGVAIGLAAAVTASLMWGGGVTALREWSRVIRARTTTAGDAYAPNNQSLAAFAARLSAPHRFVAFVPLRGSADVVVGPSVAGRAFGPTAARVTAGLVLLATVAAVVWGRRSASARVNTFNRVGAILAATFVALPIAWDHYLLLLFVPAAYLLRLTSRSAAARTWLLSSCAALLLHRYWRVLVATGSPWALGFGLLGIVLLWGLLMSRLVRLPLHAQFGAAR